VERHSKKPDCVRDRIVELCGDVPRIELFAREAAHGWEALGNEIDGRDIRDALRGVIEA
jgi:N6-adenosine-specific RNA methylase IME4